MVWRSWASAALRDLRARLMEEPTAPSPAASEEPEEDALTAEDVTLEVHRFAWLLDTEPLTVFELDGQGVVPGSRVWTGEDPPDDLPVVLLCADGRRAPKVALDLRRRGVEAWSVRGGVEGWLRATAGPPT